MKRMTLAFSLVCLVVLAGSGCASLGKMPKMPWEEEEPEYKIPTKMVVTWKDAVRYNPHDPPTRGFGGRIHFYDESNKPVQVQGTLTVYGYDDSAPGETDVERPDRKYIFAADSLDGHYSLSKLGHSYSFWIPWDHAGGEQKDITLAPFFRSATGQLLMSEQSKHVLPGVTKKESTEQQTSPSDRLASDIAPVNFQKEAPAPSAQESRMRTTTIQLPTQMSEHLRNAPPFPYVRSKPQPIERPHGPNQVEGIHPMMPPPQQPPMQHSVTQQMQDVQARSLHVKPGVNLQNFRPDFANATQYSQYLATGQETLAPQKAPGLPAGFPQSTHPAPSPQIGPQGGGHPQNPQSPSLWPPGLPLPPSHHQNAGPGFAG